jgi:TRAP-type C4-dicarboxylate transport system permease small subunit
MLFNQIYRKFEQFTAVLAAISALLILSMSIWVTYDVLARHFFSISSPWSFDLSEYSLVWITFLGAPWVLLQDRHVRIEIFIDVLSIKTQRIFGILVCFIAFISCVILAWRTGIAAYEYFDRNIMMPRIWRIPRIYPYIIVPIGTALLAASFLLRLGLYIRSENPEALLQLKSSAGQDNGLTAKKSE